jgi:hypothetical protein
MVILRLEEAKYIVAGSTELALSQMNRHYWRNKDGTLQYRAFSMVLGEFYDTEETAGQQPTASYGQQPTASYGQQQTAGGGYGQQTSPSATTTLQNVASTPQWEWDSNRGTYYWYDITTGEYVFQDGTRTRQ